MKETGTESWVSRVVIKAQYVAHQLAYSVRLFCCRYFSFIFLPTKLDYTLDVRVLFSSFIIFRCHFAIWWSPREILLFVFASFELVLVYVERHVFLATSHRLSLINSKPLINTSCFFESTVKHMFSHLHYQKSLIIRRLYYL